MASFRTAAIVTLVVAILGTHDMGKLTSSGEESFPHSAASQETPEKCAPDPDPRYPRQRILERFARILKQSIPKDATYVSKLHSDWEGKNLRFFVYDLTDPENVYSDVKQYQFKKGFLCIRFVDNHVYHFSPFFIPYSFSHIAFLEQGELKVFKLLNCEGKGDKLDDVVTYLEQKLKDNPDKDEIIGRVKEYRKSGEYFTIDDTSVRCHEVKTKRKS